MLGLGPEMKAFSKSGMIALFFGVMLSGCFVGRKELLRTASPDGKVEAVLEESNAGATARYVYRVYILPAGAAVPRDKDDKKRLVFNASSLKECHVSWSGDRQVTIGHPEADIHYYRNYWYHTDPHHFLGYKVMIILRQETSDEQGVVPTDVPLATKTSP